jgi:serine O-acetyltransferase
MDNQFLQSLFLKHKETSKYPPTSVICKVATKILLTLFPEQTRIVFNSPQDIQDKLDGFEKELTEILATIPEGLVESPSVLSKRFFDGLPEVYNLLLTDVESITLGDPAATNEYEVIRAYPGFYAIAFYRIAHSMYKIKIPLLPRVITEYAHSKAGIDIHPGADIGSHFFIDHGTGVVIGETATIGRNVKMYQGVTLGALSVAKELAGRKRHPTIEDNVVIYSGATILGGSTVVGHNSIIGGNVWLTQSVPAYSKVYHLPEIKISSKEETF